MHTGLHHNKKLIFVDNTALQEFRTCPAKYKWRIGKGLKESRLEMSGDEKPPISAPLLFGSAMHTALDKLYAEQSPKLAGEAFLEAFQPPPDDSKRTPLRGIEMLSEYWKKWQELIESYTTVICETSFRAPLGTVIHPVTQEEWKVVYSGLVDKIITTNDGLSMCIDHKTSSMQTAALAKSYDQANQFQGYLFGARNAPGIGLPITSLIVDLLLLWPKNNGFERPQVEYDEDRQKDWKKDILQTCRLILLADHDDTWPKYGQQACVSFNQLCQFFRLCNTPDWNQPSLEEGFYSEDFWEAERT